MEHKSYDLSSYDFTCLHKNNFNRAYVGVFHLGRSMMIQLLCIGRSKIVTVRRMDKYCETYIDTYYDDINSDMINLARKLGGMAL